MNKAHRDPRRVYAYLLRALSKAWRSCTCRAAKKIKLSQPQQLMAQDREIIDEAYAGDIIGVFDRGFFFNRRYDLHAGQKVWGVSGEFRPSRPNISRVSARPIRSNVSNLLKVRCRLHREGAIQIFHEPNTGMEEVINGVVGTLQFDVFEYRLKTNTTWKSGRRAFPINTCAGLKMRNSESETADITSIQSLFRIFRDRYLLLFTDEWNIRWAQEKTHGWKLRNSAGH